MQELLLQVWQRTAKPVFLITHDIEEAVFLATDLILLAPNPGQIVERLHLDFGQRYAAGERRGRSSPTRVLSKPANTCWRKVFSQRRCRPQRSCMSSSPRPP
jgi:taurine transport system ATP-binding protein